MTANAFNVAIPTDVFVCRSMSYYQYLQLFEFGLSCRLSDDVFLNVYRLLR